MKREYERQLNEGNRDVIITTSCPAVNTLVQKYYPELCRYLSPVVSPMVAHAIDIKRRRPDARVVFIGPCLAKRKRLRATLWTRY